METDPREMLPFLDMVRNVAVFMGGTNGGPKYLKVFDKSARRYKYQRQWDVVLKNSNSAAAVESSEFGGILNLIPLVPILRFFAACRHL